MSNCSTVTQPLWTHNMSTLKPARRPHQGPLLSTKNTKHWLQFTRAYRSWILLCAPTEHHGKACLSVVSDHIHPYMAGCFQQSNQPQWKCYHIMSTQTKTSEECFQHLVESMTQSSEGKMRPDPILAKWVVNLYTVWVMRGHTYCVRIQEGLESHSLLMTEAMASLS